MWHEAAVNDREMLRLARTAALVCCDREIGGMAERQERAVLNYLRLVRCSDRRDAGIGSKEPRAEVECTTDLHQESLSLLGSTAAHSRSRNGSRIRQPDANLSSA